MNPPNTPSQSAQFEPSQQAINPPPDITPVPMPQKQVSKLGILVVVLFLFVLVGGSGVFAAMVAYDKITIGNSMVQSAVREAVLSLPFAPKTPAYVIERTALSMSNVLSTSIDASVAISSNTLVSIAGSNNLDVSAKGSIDRTDMDNLKSQFSFKVGNLLSADVKSVDKKIYVKVNSFPYKLLEPVISIPEETFTNTFSKWIVWDSNVLDTEARKLVDENNKTKSPSLMQLTDLLNNKKLMSKVSLTTETLDGTMVYKLHPSIDGEFVSDYVSQFGDQNMKETEASRKWFESLKDVNFDIYVDKTSYLVRKIALSFGSTQDNSLVAPLLSLVPLVGGGDFRVAAVVSLSDHNSSFPVSAPSDTKNWQDAYGELTAAMMATNSGSLVMINPEHQFAEARDAKRRADLLAITNAIYQYASEHNGKLPVSDTTAFPTKEICIGTNAFCFDLAHAGEVNSTIVPKYIALMPKDPKNGTDSDTKYTIYMDATGRLQAKAVSESDPSIPIIVTR